MRLCLSHHSSTNPHRQCGISAAKLQREGDGSGKGRGQPGAQHLQGLGLAHLHQRGEVQRAQPGGSQRAVRVRVVLLQGQQRRAVSW
jgi:hypothetical protein